MKIRAFVLPIIVVAVLGCEAVDLAAPSEAADVKTAQIQGAASYRERIRLPPESQLTVVLEDVSRMDVAATELASYTQALEGGPPYPFTLNYSVDDQETRKRYSVSARIEHDGQLLFITDQHYNPFEKGMDAAEESLKLLLRRVAGR